MSVSATLVKELRERTGLGMMECKTALLETQGDIEKAIENLRKSGQAKAAKKAGRIAAEGAVMARVDNLTKTAAMVEINSETDFVARDANFLNFAQQVVDRIVTARIGSLADLMALSINNENATSFEEARHALVQKIGENISVRRIALWSTSGDHILCSYVHNNKIGVLIELKGGSQELAKDLAMHIAAVNPLVVTPQQVPEETINKEKEIYSAQAKESGKPMEIVEKMVAGRVQKFVAEVSLVEQPFVKDAEVKVRDLLKSAQAEVIRFLRFEVGEGIEKAEGDFAAEVLAQAGLK